MLAEIHSRLLANRRNLILTWVASSLEIVLAEPDGAFFMIMSSVSDRS